MKTNSFLLCHFSFVGLAIVAFGTLILLAMESELEITMNNPVASAANESNWKKGPLPPDTWFWGGVVIDPVGDGFMFADFRGDHVILIPNNQRVEAKDILYYNNSLTHPFRPTN